MGNSHRKPKKRNSSPAQDALQTLRSQCDSGIPEASNQLRDDFTDFNESFVSFESFKGEDNQQTASDSITEHVSGYVESPEQLNLYNVHASFLSSFLNATSMHCQAEFEPLYEVVKSHLWSVHSPEYVTMCASNILSILKIYGDSIPEDSEVASKKTQIMFHILDCLHAHISQMKSRHWHSISKSDCQSCHGCDIKSMVFKHMVSRNALTKDNICLICLEIFPKGQYLQHSVSENHVKAKLRLTQDIYPYSCSGCEQRFTSQQDLNFHCVLHVDSEENCSKANDVKVFKPTCCYLCLAPFPDAKSLKHHELKSLEHGFRKEIAMELALRARNASDELCKSDSNATTGMKSPRHVLPEFVIDDVSEKTIKDSNVTKKENGAQTCSTNWGNESGEDVNPMLYYCCPCASYVPKANVVEHESGQRHTQCRKAWVLQFRKASQPFEEQKTNQDASILPIESSISVLPIKYMDGKEATYENTSVVENITSNVEAIKDTACEKAPTVGNHSLTETNDLVTEEIIRKKMEEYLSLEEPIVCRDEDDGYYSCKQCPAKLFFPAMVGHVTGKAHLKLLPVLDQSVVDKKVEILSYLFSLRCQKNMHLLLVVNALSVSKVIRWATKTPGTKRRKRAALILFPEENAEVATPNVNINCSELEKSIPSQHDQSLDLASITSLPSRMNNVSQSGVLCLKEEAANQTRADGHVTEMCSQTNIVPVEAINEAQMQEGKEYINSHDIADMAQLSSQIMKQSHVDPSRRAEDLQPIPHSPDALISQVETLVIGEGEGTTLLDQLHQACPGRDISDCEMQCGICGVIFQIYNEDLDLSLDVHKNDPQHVLATEVPTKRDPQTMAESAKTTNASGNRQNPTTSVSSRKVSKPNICNGKSYIIAEVFSLEQKHIVTTEKIHHCKLCQVNLKTDSQFMHHLLFPKHLSEKWLNGLTDEEVNQRIKNLKSLMKYKYAGVALQSAIDRISILMAKHKRSCPEIIGQPAATSLSNQSSKVTAPISSRVFVASASNADDGGSVASCSGSSTSNMSRQSLTNHSNSFKPKVSNSNFTVAVPLTGSLETVSSHFESKKRRCHFCELCKRNMDINDKISHERGKVHKANLLLQ